jgi:nucleoside-diphosphate-sugar epimerase
MRETVPERIDSVLVTGGTGFLGLHICESFSRQGVNVTALDLRPFQTEDEITDVNYVRCDVRQEEAVRNAIADADAVIHAASALPNWDDSEVRDVTVEGTRTVLRASREQEVDRVVHVSSAAVYGRRDRPPVSEESTLEPRSLYGKAKLKAEEVCEEARQSGQCVSILRPQAMIGSQRLGVFQILFDWVDSGANIPLIGSGHNRYQLLHVRDMVRAIEELLTVERAQANATYNVGADEFDTMREDFQALIDRAGTGKRVIGTPAVLAITALDVLTRLDMCPLYPSLYRTAEEDTYLAVEKLKALGWRPQYSNQEALIDTFDWYREQYDVNTTGSGVGNRSARDQLALEPIKRLFSVF